LSADADSLAVPWSQCRLACLSGWSQPPGRVRL